MTNHPLTKWAIKTAKEAPVVGCVSFTAIMFIVAMKNSNISDVLYVFGGLLAILTIGYAVFSAAFDVVIWAIKRKANALQDENEQEKGQVE